jgi:hypothetical protein
MDHPKSGLPDFGHFKCASRINPTCVVKPAGDTWEAEAKRLENALEPGMEASGEHVHRAAVGVVGGVGDELIVEAEPHVG